MKKIFFSSFMFLFILGACTQNDPEPEIIIDPEESFVTGDWRLVKSVGSMVDVTLEGDDLEREEVYTFTNEGTFTKTVDAEDFHSEATGTFVIEEVSEEMQDRYIGVVVLTFTGGDGMAYNCSSDEVERESLHISLEHQLVNISWAPCDGAWLYYDN
ncbi:hypothetical protein DN752_04005 [Echinicola strongylocentroti]|uniref:Lipocalin-like domain-containing protein n=1 Tax=Echinicola strongylocentroti TaxID=1795355 RepID=A0A2Z4IE79_9BACT|nr:hypothetical protein [Echinicola strongylocentroti]AWW29372.1 hypothetical protein DN752_04005 [Echinicola strongylocentroti]